MKLESCSGSTANTQRSELNRQDAVPSMKGEEESHLVLAAHDAVAVGQAEPQQRHRGQAAPVWRGRSVGGSQSPERAL